MMNDKPNVKSPKSTHFQPGQSGNPKGRPKGRSKPSWDFEKMLEETISVSTMSGSTRKVTRSRALFEALFSAALKGNASANKLLLKRGKIDVKVEVATALNQYKEKSAREAHAATLELRRRIDQMVQRREENDGKS